MLCPENPNMPIAHQQRYQGEAEDTAMLCPYGWGFYMTGIEPARI